MGPVAGGDASVKTAPLVNNDAPSFSPITDLRRLRRTVRVGPAVRTLWSGRIGLGRICRLVCADAAHMAFGTHRLGSHGDRLD